MRATTCQELSDEACDQRVLTALRQTGAVSEFYQTDKGRGDNWYSKDPLYQWASENEGRGKVFMVASAGNESLSFPLAPARWDFVLSISADGSEEPVNTASDLCVNLLDFSDNADFFKSSYSNSGEIRANGNYTGTLFDPDAGIQGSSFAAPLASYDVAMYLLGKDAAGCLDALTYADEMDGPWCNITGAAAESAFCDGFGLP